MSARTRRMNLGTDEATGKYLCSHRTYGPYVQPGDNEDPESPTISLPKGKNLEDVDPSCENSSPCPEIGYDPEPAKSAPVSDDLVPMSPVTASSKA